MGPSALVVRLALTAIVGGLGIGLLQRVTALQDTPKFCLQIGLSVITVIVMARMAGLA